MTEPAKSIRVQILQRVVELIRAEVDAQVRWPDRVQVLDHDPGGNTFGEAILAMNMVGTPDEVLLSGGVDQPTGDDFVITFVGLARRKKMTAAMARGRVDEFYQAIRRVAYAAAYGGQLNDFQTDDGLRPVSATSIGQVDGPISDPAGEGAGHWGFVRVDFRVQTLEYNA